MEASLPPWGRGACATDDQGSETGEVKGSWSGGRLGGRSGAEDGRAVLKLVMGIPKSGSHGNCRSTDHVIGLVSSRACSCCSLACGHLGQWEKGGNLSLLEGWGLELPRCLKFVEWRS